MFCLETEQLYGLIGLSVIMPSLTTRDVLGTFDHHLLWRWLNRRQ
jgi:hypothetical protein